MPVYPTQLVPTIQRVLPALCGGATPMLSEPDGRELLRLERLRADTGAAVRYVVAGPADRPVGLLPIYPVAAPYGPREDPATWLGEAATGPRWRAGHYLGSPGTLPAVMPVRSDLPPDPVRAVLIEAARRALRAEGAVGFLCTPLLDDELLRSVAPVVVPTGALTAHTEEAYLDLDFGSFDEYLRSRAPERRKKIRKEIRRFHAQGLRVERAELRRQYVRLAPLLRNVELKYGAGAGVEVYETYLLSLGLALGDQVVCLVAYRGRDPVAFSVSGEHGGSWWVRCWGCDYARTAGTNAYFYLTCYEPLRLATEAGAHRLRLGDGSLGAKVRRGARLRRLTTLAVPPPAAPIARVGPDRPAGVEISVRDTVRAVPPGAGPLLGEQQLRELARVERIWRSLGVRPWYVVAERAGRTVGLLPAYPAGERHYLGWRAADLFPDTTRTRRWRRGLLLGSDLTASSVLAADGTELGATLLRTAFARAAAEATDHICLPHLHDDQYDLLRAAAPTATWLISESADAVLDLTFDSFETYARQLPSRRTAIRRERRRFLASGVALRAVPPADVANELAILQAGLERKYGTAATTVEDERRYLSGTAAAMGPAGTALVAYCGDRLVAGSVLWDLGEDWRVRSWGCDLAHPAVRRDYLYFNLMYYEPMLRACAAGARRLLLGTGSLETKTLRGARLRRRRSVAWEVADVPA